MGRMRHGRVRQPFARRAGGVSDRQSPPSRPLPWAPVLPIVLASVRDFSMTQTTIRFFDEAARLMNDAAGVASGVRREFDTVMRTQAERILRDLDVVQREEFEAVKEMARLAREENEALKARIAMLEAKADKPSKKSKDSA